MYHNFFIPSSVNGYLGCFHVLPIVNSAAINNGIHVSFSILVSSGYMPQSGIAGSYGGFIPSFLRCLHTVFLSGYISLLSRQQCKRIPFSWGIFMIQGSNQGLLHCSPILYHLIHQRSSFSIVAVQIYILTNNVRGFSFLHTLSSIYYL